MKLMLVFLLFTSSGVAAAESKLNAINILNRDVATAEIEIDKLLQVSDSVERQKHVTKLDALKVQIDADLKPALNLAKKHADLAKAVKGYYLAAQNYFDSAFARSSLAAQRSKSELDAADNAMHLEEKLASID